MGIAHQITKWYSNFKGLDKRNSPLSSSSQHATEIENALYRKSGAINKRYGYHGKVPSQGGYGLTVFDNVNMLTGAVNQELITLDQNLWKKEEDSFTISYSGTETPAYSIEVNPDTSNFKLTLYTNGTQVWAYDLGTGISDTNPIATLESTLNATTSVTKFSATKTGSGLTSAAFFTPVSITDFSGSSVSLPYYKWTEIQTANSAITNSFTIDTNNSSFENASFASINSVLFIASEGNPLMKYDGSRVYKAGMPKPVTPTLATASGSNGKDHGYYMYRITYQFEDAKGNLIEGTISEPGTDSSDNTYVYVSNSSHDTVTVTLPTLADSEGFNTSDPSKLKIRIWRTNHQDSPPAAGDEFTQAFYLLGSVNNGTASFPDTFTDKSADTEFYSFPSNDPDLPVENCKYVTVHQNMLFLSGNKAKPNTVYYSDILAPEGFPSTDNAFDIDSGLGQVITGISSLSSTFFVFHKNSIHAVTGDVGSDIFKVDLVSNEGGIGCEAFHTIQELKGNLVFLSEKGMYGISRVGELVEISSIISPDFESISKSFNFKKAIIFNWVDKELLMLHLPVEQAATGPKLATSTDSEIFIFDYYRQAWLKWSNVDFSGGIVNLNKKIYFSERRRDTSGTLKSVCYRFSDTQNTNDYNDHNKPIKFIYKTNWEIMGQPSIFKKFLRLKLFALTAQENFESETFKIKADIQKNFSTSIDASITYDFGLASAGGWGAFKWGTASWGSPLLEQMKSKLPTGKCKSLRVCFSNSEASQNVLLTGYEMEVAAPYRAEIKE